MGQLQIAIDGPVAAGKGDIAARLAKQLNLIYIYTGAMYRALGLACLGKSIPTKDKNKVLEVLNQSSIDLLPADKSGEYPYRVMLNNQDITSQLLRPDVAMSASDVSTIPEVRLEMVKRQKLLANNKSVVMEGRDIGLRVLPNAQLKIYLTATTHERAQRRFKQFLSKGIQKDFNEVLEDTQKRDLQDTTRDTDPLQKLPDAWELDTTNLSQDEVVEKIIQELNHRKLL